MSSPEIPLFPLNTVLFPGGVLPLRIFEARYLSMVSECMKNGTGFGVVTIHEGREVGEMNSFHAVGTLARIVDFDRLEDGLLGITCVGEERLQVVSHRTRSDQLRLGEIEAVPADPRLPPPEQFSALETFLRNVLGRDELQFYTRFLNKDWENAAWIGNRLAELMPLPLPAKQMLLELKDPLQRLEVLHNILKQKDII